MTPSLRRQLFETIPKNMILSTQEVAPQSAEHLEMETCPTSSEEVNDAKSCNLL